MCDGPAGIYILANTGEGSPVEISRGCEGCENGGYLALNEYEIEP